MFILVMNSEDGTNSLIDTMVFDLLTTRICANVFNFSVYNLDISQNMTEI